MSSTPPVPHSRENAVSFFQGYVKRNAAVLAGKSVIDLSAGSGYMASLFENVGAHVQLYDLFPEQNQFAKGTCSFVDLQQPWPIADGCADYVILGETIEHLPDQFHFFKEAARALRPGGTLLLTTPNSSSLRSRFSQFLMESEHYSTPAPNELNAYTRWQETDRGYFSKLFISGVLRLRTLAALNGLRIKKIYPSPASSTSWLLMIFYPLIYYFSRRNLSRQLRHDPEHALVYREIFELSNSINILVGKHLLMEYTKAGSGI
jgi:SAM-dependent methyltransferase